jgi:hypothetical protein
MADLIRSGLTHAPPVRAWLGLIGEGKIAQLSATQIVAAQTYIDSFPAGFGGPETQAAFARMKAAIAAGLASRDMHPATTAALNRSR